MDMVESNVPMQAWMAGGWGRAHGHGGVVRAGSWVRHGRVEGVEVLKAEDIEDADASVDFRLGDGDRLIDLLHAPGQAGAKRGPSGGGGGMPMRRRAELAYERATWWHNGRPARQRGRRVKPRVEGAREASQAAL